MSTLLNTVDTYLSLQPFKDVEELNNNTIEIREQYADELTPSTKQVLDVLHRYSCKYPGVCYLSKNSIAEMVGVSRRTVIRACNQLESLGIIKQYELKRRNGDRRQSSNAIVFVAVKSVENDEQKQQCHTMCHTVHTLSKTQKPLNNTNDTRTIDFVDKKEVVKDLPTVTADIKRGLRDKMPTYLYDLLSPYLNLDDLYEAYGTLLRGKALIDKSIVFESHEGLFTDAVLSVINAYKRGKIRNLFAVLYTAARDTTAQIYRKSNYKVDDWLSW